MYNKCDGLKSRNLLLQNNNINSNTTTIILLRFGENSLYYNPSKYPSKIKINFVFPKYEKKVYN